MRLMIKLLLALAIAVALILFPDIADQTVRIEAFGWLFESRQGAFIVALLLLFFLIGLVRAVLRAFVTGPGAAWRSLRMGSRKRREKRLREGVGMWIDMRGDSGARQIKRARGVLPDWAMGLMKILSIDAKDQQLGGEGDDPLAVALAARIATDPAARHKSDPATRKAHLEAWLRVHPEAPLALARLADLAEEEGDWLRASELLEAQWGRGQQSSHSLKPRLSHAYLQLAESDAGNAMVWLRKAYRLMPEDARVVLGYGRALIEGGESRSAARIWSARLEAHDDFAVAEALLPLLQEDGMRAYRKLEKGRQGSTAQRWLRAELAHAVKLDGLAREQMQALADEGVARAWQSLGSWYDAAGDAGQAMNCYRRALES